MTSSIQQSITTPIRIAFVLEDHHLRQLDQILRTDHATVEYIAVTKSLVATTYESVEDLMRVGNPLDDPLMRLEARRITRDTHVTLIFQHATQLIMLTILNDDSHHPDFRHQISSELAAWLEQIKAPHSDLIMALRPWVVIPVMCLVGMACLMLGLILPSWVMSFRGDIWIPASAVALPLFLALVIWTERRFFPAGQFNFGSGRKSKRDKG